MGVNNVEALPRVGAAKFARGSCVAARGKCKAVELKISVIDRAQRFKLIAHEAAELRLFGRRPHVGDDQNTHLLLIVHVVAVDSLSDPLQAAVRAVLKQLGASMPYRIQGRIHSTFHHALSRINGAAGQGTVEYVALILLVAGVLAGVIVAGKSLKGGGIAQTVVAKLKESIDSVGSAKP